MKKTAFVSILFFALTSVSAQVNVNVSSTESYVIGLNKISHIQLQFVKNEMEMMSKVNSAEFVFNDNLLLIHPDTTDISPLEYKEIEKILLKFFHQADIYRKENANYSKLKAEYNKTDKYIIK